MDDRWAVVLAVATFGGALAVTDGHLAGPPLAAALVLVAVAGGTRRPLVVCLAAAALAAALAGRSLDGLRAPVPAGPVHGEVVLAGDPLPDGRGGAAVDVIWQGRRYRATARRSAGAALDRRLAGDRVVVAGRLEGPGPYERLLVHRHLAGRLTVDHVVGWTPGDPASRMANGLRRTLARGAEVLPERRAALLLGLTLGDTRAQDADMADAFRAAGLTHLLAVSGQNVAFVLVVASPVLTRLRFGARWALTLVVLGGFALLTRFEPSVVRATAMAGVAATGSALGRPASSLRTLALAVSAALLVDPLLAGALGFRLSVAGAGGIIVAARPLERALPGPRWLAAPLSVTLAAQLAVAPLLVAAFGSVPVASLPANLLAVPVTGPVMVWGLTAGLVAGVLGGVPAAALHLPTGVALAWIDRVAGATAGWPLGELGAAQVLVLTTACAALLLSAWRPASWSTGGAAGRGASAPPDAGGSSPGPGGARWRPAARVVAVAVVVVTLASAASVARPVPGGTGGAPLGVGAEAWWSGGAVVVAVDGRAGVSTVLSRLRSQGVGRVDVLIARSDARRVADLAATLQRRWPSLVVLAPATDHDGAGVRIAGASTPEPGTVLDVGGLRLVVAAGAAGRLEVTVVPIGRAAAGPPGRGPPGARRTGGGRGLGPP